MPAVGENLLSRRGRQQLIDQQEHRLDEVCVAGLLLQRLSKLNERIDVTPLSAAPTWLAVTGMVSPSLISRLPAQLTGLHLFHVSGADVPRVSRTVSSFKSTITIFVPAPASFAGTM